MKKVFLIITVVLLIAVIAGMGVKISFMSTDYDKLEKELKAEKKNDTTEEGQEESTGVEFLSIMDQKVQALMNVLGGGFDPNNGENYYFSNHTVTLEDIKAKLDGIGTYHTAGPSPLFMVTKAEKDDKQYTLTVNVIFPDYNATVGLNEVFPYYADYNKTVALTNPQVDMNNMPVATYNNLKQGNTYTVIFDTNNTFVSSTLS